MSEQSATDSVMDGHIQQLIELKLIGNLEAHPITLVRGLARALTACQAKLEVACFDRDTYKNHMERANAKLASAEADITQLHDGLNGEARGRLQAEAERDKLQAFKNFVHRRLDEAGIEKEPNGEHSNHGCRIGDRLDIVFAERDSAYETAAKVCDEYFTSIRHYDAVSPVQISNCAVAIRALKHTPEPIKAAGIVIPPISEGGSTSTMPQDQSAPAAPELPKEPEHIAITRHGSINLQQMETLNYIDDILRAAESLRRDAGRCKDALRIVRSYMPIHEWADTHHIPHSVIITVCEEIDAALAGAGK